ncbi:MAG: hypothetical protein N2662_11690 [Bacteroidales bacterium]|nr:hypothetical protein [Bacteroidales bacterium]
MKKEILILSLSTIFTTFNLSAQTTTNRASSAQVRGNGSAYVDSNKNGICDNYEVRRANASGLLGKGGREGRYGKGKCNGVNGKNFVDTNKNGICDNFERRNNNFSSQ